MVSERVKFTIEVVGIFAIVGSLIFVGLQMRQTHEIALVTLMQMRSDAARELAAAQIGSEPLLAIDQKLQAGEVLTPYETMTRSLQPFVFFNQFENSHFLFKTGYMTEEQWRSDIDAIKYYMTIEPYYKEYWDEHKHIFRESYVSSIEESLGLD